MVVDTVDVSNVAWAVGMVVFALLALWFSAGRPPKPVRVVVYGTLGLAWFALIGFWLLAAIGAVVWSFFA